MNWEEELEKLEKLLNEKTLIINKINEVKEKLNDEKHIMLKDITYNTQLKNETQRKIAYTEKVKENKKYQELKVTEKELLQKLSMCENKIEIQRWKLRFLKSDKND